MTENPSNSHNSSPRPGYDIKQHVPPEFRGWDVSYPDYSPPDFTAESVLTTGVAQGWADPESPKDVNFSSRPSFEGELKFDDQTGRPLNPKGRQGIQGRGELGKWGVNNAADPIVIAVDNAGARKILLIRRKDTQEWALPGGMVDPGENVSLTAKRELKEEAGIDLSDIPATVVAQGYVDDPRNTDNAWMETVASVMVINHIPEPKAGDDAEDSKWFDLENIEALKEATDGLYASHDELIQKALEQLTQ